tara:strand:- start:304 stop:558 length:255 start_codon:yes stop_codon:yes gene_type:complete
MDKIVLGFSDVSDMRDAAGGVELASSSHIVRIHYTYFYETHSRTPNSNDLFVPSFAFGGGLLCKFTGSKCPKVDFTELVEREGI